MGSLDGKVAFITGAARGQGRAHAVRLATDGADIIGIDVPHATPTVPHSLGTATDLAETVRLVESLGRRIVTYEVDVRDAEALATAVRDGVAVLGRLDIVVANAGVSQRLVNLWETTLEEWDDQIAINLTGVFNTIRAVVPVLLEADRGGAIVLTSSGAGLAGVRNIGAYGAAKHGVVGLAKTLANELARHDIRVNAVCPGTVGTPMVTGNATQDAVFSPDVANPTLEHTKEVLRKVAPLGRPWLEPEDIANAVAFLVGPEGRYITGIAMPVDQGVVNK